MARRFLDPSLAPPILLLNFVLYVFVLSIAGRTMDSMIDGTELEGGNAATPSFVVTSLGAGAVGVASLVAALRRRLRENADTAAAASASAFIAWSLQLLAFGFACKEISIGNTGTTLKFMEVFVITLTITQGLYILVIHASSLGL